jgi:hypothetical protein
MQQVSISYGPYREYSCEYKTYNFIKEHHLEPSEEIPLFVILLSNQLGIFTFCSIAE